MQTASQSERAELLLLPGLACDRTVWRSQISALQDRCNCTVVDLSGCKSFAETADEVLRTAPPKFALAGHSMGARIALEMAVRAPERVERLALLSTSIQPVTPEEMVHRRRLAALVRREGMEGAFEQWLLPMLRPRCREDGSLTEALSAMFRRASPEIFEAQIEAALQRRDLRAALPTLRCPTLVLCGADDMWSPPAQNELIAAAIPNARLEIARDSGHMVTVEAPETVSAAFRNWLAAAGPVIVPAPNAARAGG